MLGPQDVTIISNMDIQKTPPKTIEEVGTHLFYMARDLSEIKLTLKDTPTRKEMDDVKLKIVTIEREIETMKNYRENAIKEINKEFVSKNEFKVGLTTITVILSIVVAVVTIWSNIKG